MELNRSPHSSQAALEVLFAGLQSQHAAIGALRVQVVALEGRAAAAEAAGATTVARLEERLAAAATERSAADARLRQLEQRLEGTSNLVGRQAALDEIASIIGVAVEEHDIALVDAEASGHPAAAAPPPAAAAVHPGSTCGAPGTAESYLHIGEGAHGTADGQEERGKGGCSGSAAGAGDRGADGGNANGASESPGSEAPTADREGGVVATATDAEVRSQQPATDAEVAGQAPATDTPLGSQAPATDSQVDAPATATDPAYSNADNKQGSNGSSASPHAHSAARASSGRTTAAAVTNQLPNCGASAAAEIQAPPETSAEALGELRPSDRQQVAALGPATSAAGHDAGAGREGGHCVVAATFPAQGGSPAPCGLAGSRAPPSPGMPLAALPPVLSAQPLRRGCCLPTLDSWARPSPCAPCAAAHMRLADVVELLRKRPSLKQTGLLWKLQASLAEAVAEQGRLQRWAGGGPARQGAG